MLNVVTDFALLAVWVPALYTSMLPKKTKWLMFGLFGVGLSIVSLELPFETFLLHCTLLAVLITT
jgi:hypothetical protein